MTRHCDNCNKIIPLGGDYIEVKAIGVKDFAKLFGTDSLDFCKITCLVKFWSEKNQRANSAKEKVTKTT